MKAADGKHECKVAPAPEAKSHDVHLITWSIFSHWGVKRFSFHRLWFRLLSLRTKILFRCTNDMFSICSETRIPNVRVCVCVFAVQQSPTVCLPWCPAAMISSRQNCLTQTSSCGHGRYFCEQLWMYAGLLETLFYRRCETRQTSEGRQNLLILFWSLSNWHRPFILQMTFARPCRNLKQ